MYSSSLEQLELWASATTNNSDWAQRQTDAKIERAARIFDSTSSTLETCIFLSLRHKDISKEALAVFKHSPQGTRRHLL